MTQPQYSSNRVKVFHMTHQWIAGISDDLFMNTGIWFRLWLIKIYSQCTSKMFLDGLAVTLIGVNVGRWPRMSDYHVMKLLVFFDHRYDLQLFIHFTSAHFILINIFIIDWESIYEAIKMLIAAAGVSYNPNGPESIVTYRIDTAKTCTLHSGWNSKVMRLLSPLITGGRRG